ncbi:MAG: hypothetical protein K6E33_04820, partial [Lachnospiraceae bacterium]|nr:hypothetical protein [Lachnospiraceae bacterium]
EDTKSTFNLSNPLLGGQLQGLAEMRDGNNGEYFNGTSTAIDKDNYTVTISGSGMDIDNCTLANDGGTIYLGNTAFHFTSWTYDNATGDYTFSIDPNDSNISLFGAKAGKNAWVGAKVNYQGIPYYMEQMNNWIRSFASMVNGVFSAGVTSTGADAGILLTGVSGSGDEEYTEEQLLNKDTDTEGKGYYYLNAGNFKVADAMIKDATLLGTRADAEEGVAEYKNVTKLISLLSSTEVEGAMNYRGGSAGTFLASILGDSALNMSNANTFQSNYESIKNTIENQKMSVSGVDEDEEALKMVQYQRSYTLSSKMLSTFTEIYDRLILETGV